MKTEKISQEDLKSKLEIIKNIMEKIDLDNNKIIFLNLQSFYSYLKTYFHIDIEKIMQDIEPFIPLTLCFNLDKSLFNLLSFALEEDLDYNQFNYLKKSFYDKARISFLNLIRKTKSDTEWKKILYACEELRQIAK